MDAVLAFGFGYQEMIIVLFIALLLFGKKLPEVARNMGKGDSPSSRRVCGASRTKCTELPHMPPGPQLPNGRWPTTSSTT
ncbi:MAG: hypothetical protein Ct9H300mP1_24560 [Planctomycetaceae bacterium]|nr:MAG: hypothetical protein Ct9H300mP1_24560 [Planctomycetaceae bacterium]